MSRVDYDEMAGRYDAHRRLDLSGLEDWRAAIQRYLPRKQNPRILDLGSGTGQFSSLLAEWFDASVVAAEPSEGMRKAARRKGADPHVVHVGASGDRLPLRDRCCDAAWLSTVLHHIPDLTACARDLRRVLTDDSVVLIRSAFPGRLDDITVFRFFPAARRVVDTFPSVEATVKAFGAAGFEQRALESVPQVSAPSLRDAVERVRLRADTTLQGISDEDFAAGLAELERVAATEGGNAAVVDRLDLLVFSCCNR